MKNFYPVQVYDIKFQDDHMKTKKIQLFKEYRSNPHNAHRNSRLSASFRK